MYINVLKLLGRVALVFIKILSILVGLLAIFFVLLLIIFANYTNLLLSFIVAILISFILIWLADKGLERLDEWHPFKPRSSKWTRRNR